MGNQNDKQIADDLKKALVSGGIIINEFHYSVNSETGDITAFVTSGSFESKDEFERQGLVWDAINKEVPKEEVLHISGVIPMTPQEGSVLNK